MSKQQEFEGKNIIVFSKFNGMNTQSARHDLPEDKAAWMENLQPIAPNNLLCVPAPASSPIATISGETITKQFYFNFGETQDYIICFCASGAAYAVTNPQGTVTKFANAGTFSTNPDCTQWGTTRILIADSKVGYCTWDTFAFVGYTGVSPNITVTAGGSGYSSGATVAISGGSGSGATATANVVDGVVVSITLTNPGTGYVASDMLTVTISPVSAGSGATAIAHPWPNIPLSPTTLAVYSGRVWIAGGNTIIYTGTGATYGGIGYDDFISGDASGSTTIQDADLIHAIEALRALNNYLFIFGDGSVKQIGNISLNSAATATNFTIITLSSDQGTIFRDTIVSYNRLVIFANNVGVFAVFGSSVEKISGDMDGIFRLTNFSQNLVAAVNDINNIHVYMLLVKYKDPINGTRSLLLGFMDKKWFVMSQGNSLSFIVSSIIDGVWETFSTSGNDITQILENSTGSVSIELQTSLTSHGEPFIGKTSMRYAVAQSVGASSTMNILLESERPPNLSVNYNVSNQINFVNNSAGALQFINSGGGQLNFITDAAGFHYQYGNPGSVAGVYLGATLTGTVEAFTLNSIMIEYSEAAAFGTDQVALAQTL